MLNEFFDLKEKKKGEKLVRKVCKSYGEMVL